MSDPEAASAPAGAAGHAVRARSFGQIAEDYHRYRPRTPGELLDWVLPAGVPTVLDLAAGTGALTELLTNRVPEVIAVEPDPEMRAVLVRAAPAARVLAGRAEAIPLPEAATDAVCVASAWHWFDQPAATAEIARVLRDGGTFAVLGNSPDHEVAWVAEMRRPLASGSQPDPRPRDVLTVDLPADAPFTAVESRQLRWTWSLPVADVLALLETYSAVVVAGDERRRDLRRHAVAVLANEPGTRDRDVIELPMISRAQRARRLPRARSTGDLR